MAVIQITSREFREKQASMFALADNGEQVVIRRRGKVSHMLTPPCLRRGILSFPRSLKRGSKRGRRQYREGNVTTCTTKEELNKFLETL